jgi:tRNA A-37 threonylcarbamoyl transferase component Bud32
MTTRQVFIDGKRVALAPAALLGQGGEAEVYDLGDGRVLKWWKPANHPDFDGLPDAQAAAKRRLAEQPAKLKALPGKLPAAVVVPCGLALDKRGATVGYLMPKVSGEPLHAYGELKWRHKHPVAGEDVVAALLALHDAIAGLHRAGIVIGDCNDLNVLVDGRRVHLIDVDSYQYGGYACPMFSERFVDPRLCDAGMQPQQPHDEPSDWFAFAVMALRTLLGVGPWGGVHQPKDASKRCPPPARASRRISVYAPDIVYPRAARPLAILPDELHEVFRAIFERDQRGVFPRAVLERLRLRACSSCGEEHARVKCPACQTQAHVPPAVVHGRLRWQAIDPREVSLPYEVTRSTTPVWIDGGALWRATRLGPERIGSVLAGQTRAWVGARLGVGFYRAGGYAVGFVFRPDRGVLDDRVALPKIRGQLVAAHATVGDHRAWLWLTTSEHGRLLTTCVVIDADASVIASEQIADASWLAGITGACAAGPHLFVPTDDGVARIEVVQGVILQTRTFAETAPLVGGGDRLCLSPGAIDVLRRRDAIRMQLT